jgi:DNA-binding transcriptional LysR family regulator
MELRNLKTFQVVAEELNMTKAAKILGYTQPTITQQIQVLEREVGYSLLNRIGKRMFLTTAGKQIKVHADKLFSVMQEMESTIQQLNGPNGTLTIAAPEYYCSHHLSLLINSYIKLHPQVKLKLVSSDSRETIEMVLNTKADIGIIAGKCDDSGVELLQLDEERLVLVTSQELFEKYGEDVLLQQFPFISYEEGCNFEGVIKTCLTEIKYNPVSIIECGSEETIKRAVLNKTGIAMLSENLIKEELTNGLIIPLHFFTKRIETSLIYLKSRSEETTIQSFSDLLQEAWQVVEEK